MSYSVKPGDIFGRIGTELGKGLAEQIPKETERNRLASGLQQFEQESASLSPMQQLTRLAAIPGALDRPQLIQSFGELAKQQGINNALVNKSRGNVSPQPNPFRKPPSLNENKEKSITTREPIENTLKNYIPKTLEQIQERAGQLLDENPKLYANDPDKAFKAAQEEENRNIAVNNAFKDRRLNEQNVQKNIENGLREQANNLGTVVPSNVYSKIEDQAINAVKSKEDGGEGLTEQEAKKKYGDELDKISRQYKALETLGSPKIVPQTPKQIKDELNSIREQFKDRNDLENLADTYVSKNNLSNEKGYSLAFKIPDYKETNNYLAKTPAFKLKPIIGAPGGPGTQENRNLRENKTLEIAKKLAPIMKKEDASPLAILEELKRLNYDPDTWMNYLRNNQRELNLTERQVRELSKPLNSIGTLADFWLFSWAGMDKLLEQE
jgi:hypothetical protein